MALCVFRGYLAPASLKPGSDPKKRAQALVFRGYLAPASLKLAGQILLPLFVGSFPGLSGPGLIEAFSIMSLLFLCLQFSGAIWPRPH